MFALLGVDAFLTDVPMTHCCNSDLHTFNFRNRLAQQCQQQRVKAPFLLCINIVVPWGNMISYYYCPDGGAAGAAFPRDMQAACASDRMWQAFLQNMNTVRFAQASGVNTCSIA
jgi:hypothetical protein